MQMVRLQYGHVPLPTCICCSGTVTTGPFSQIIFNEAVSKQCQQSLLDLGNLSTNRVSFVQFHLGWSHFLEAQLNCLCTPSKNQLDSFLISRYFIPTCSHTWACICMLFRDWNEQSRDLHATSIFKVLIQYVLKFFSVVCVCCVENQYSVIF